MKRVIIRKEDGISLIEVLVAVALIASVGCAALAGLTTTTKATGSTEEKTIAESLAQAQLEDTMRAAFDYTNEPPVYSTITPSDSNYSIVIDPQNVTFADHTATTTATGLQNITINIYHHSELITTVEALKGRYD